MANKILNGKEQFSIFGLHRFQNQISIFGNDWDDRFTDDG
jgi:hypothetical protein